LKSDSLFTNPAVTPFVECPSCKRLIGYRLKVCPHCREEIDPVYARASATVVVFNTAACSSANTIKTGEYGAVIVLIASFIGMWLVDPALVIANLLTPIISIAAIVVWFFRFGRVNFGDAEYAKAKRDMRNSLKLWVVLIAVQALVLAYFFRFRR
jgi:RNA polymerase subunit RPABC4/transcription elongation factor Spt4